MEAAAADLPNPSVFSVPGSAAEVIAKLVSGPLEIGVIHLPEKHNRLAHRVIATYPGAMAVRFDDPLAAFDTVAVEQLRDREVVIDFARPNPVVLAALTRQLNARGPCRRSSRRRSGWRGRWSGRARKRRRQHHGVDQHRRCVADGRMRGEDARCGVLGGHEIVGDGDAPDLCLMAMTHPLEVTEDLSLPSGHSAPVPPDGDRIGDRPGADRAGAGSAQWPSRRTGPVEHTRPAQLAPFRQQLVEPLAEMDRRWGTQHVRTLRAFLAANGSLSDTAASTPTTAELSAAGSPRGGRRTVGGLTARESPRRTGR